MHTDHLLVEDRSRDIETTKSYCPSAVHGTSKGPVSGTQVDKDETTKEEISSAILMTRNLKYRKDFKLIKDEKESSIDVNNPSSEVTESIKLNKSTLLCHPQLNASGWDQTTAQPSQYTTPVSGYDYYGQQQTQR